MITAILTDKLVPWMVCAADEVCKIKSQNRSVHEKVILPVQFMDHWGLSVSPHHHLLLLQLFGHLDDGEEQSFKAPSVWNKPLTPPARKQLQLTSLAEEPETSIQVLEKKAHDPSMKTM